MFSWRNEEDKLWIPLLSGAMSFDGSFIYYHIICQEQSTDVKGGVLTVCEELVNIMHMNI